MRQGFKRKAIKLMKTLEKFMFPTTCICCHEIMNSDTDEVMCVLCRDKWEAAKSSVRHVFHGAPVVSFEIEDAPYNRDSYIASLVNYRPMTLESGFAVQKRLIFELKRHSFKNLTGFMSDELVSLIYETMSGVTDFSDYIIVSIPRNPVNYIKSANDGVREICKVLAKKLGCLYMPALGKRIFSKEQKYLSAEERHKNISDNIYIHNEYAGKIKNKRIILIDDVITTGSTVKESARLLMAKGRVKSVYVYSIAQNSEYLIKNI